MEKFRDKYGNWKENIQGVEKDIPMIAVSYTLRETKQRHRS